MNNRWVIGLLSCILIIILVNASMAGSVYHADESVDEQKQLLIITPALFEQAVQPLVNHKESHGINTELVTLETIVGHPQTTQGRDDAEQMKYYIKYAIEEQDVSYVLLIGGRQGQTGKWHLPVRYVAMDNGWEPQYVSDLYFSDIYDASGGFSSWDSNHNGIYGEWNEGSLPEDVDIDLYPDVALGRLPCRNVGEVKTVVAKIILYETQTRTHPRFNTMLTIAGDTYLESSNPLWVGYEGEEFAEEAIGIMSAFSPTRMYLSEEGFSGPEDVIAEFNKGFGFVYFVGHGSPKSWGTHKPNDHAFVDGLNVQDMKQLSNEELYPICVVSGCHNCQFDVGLINLLYGFKNHGLSFLTDKLIFRYEWIPEGWAWLMTNNPNGGSIVTYGTSALGHTREDKTSFTGGINEFEIQMFKEYGTNGVETTGDILKNTMQWYLDSYPVEWDENDDVLLLDQWVDVQVIQSYMLMGDPSLVIGGY